MKVKTLSTVMKDLYGIDEYHNHIKVNDEFWTDVYFIQQLTGEKWNKIHVTYIRSGVMFFDIMTGPLKLPEQYLSVKSFAASVMIKAKLDPHKDFPDEDDIDNYRFDDTFTEVVNFDNSKDKEVKESLEIIF